MLQLPGDATVPNAGSWVPGDASVPSVTSWFSGYSNAPGTAAEHTDVAHQQQQQQQQELSATQPLPQLLSELHQSVVGASAPLSPAVLCSAEATAALAEPVLGASPARGQYDPERYKPYTAVADSALETETQPCDAQPVSTQPHLLSKPGGVPISEHQLWRARQDDAPTQSLSAQSQTQLVGHSPKQAALLRLRSLTVRQSQTVKASSTSQAPHLPAEVTPITVSHPSHTLANPLTPVTQPPNAVMPPSTAQQDSHSAVHDSTVKLELPAAVDNPKAYAQQNQSTSQGIEQQVNPTAAEGIGTICHDLPVMTASHNFDHNQAEEDEGKAAELQHPDVPSDHDQLDKPRQQSKAEAAAGCVTNHEAEDAGDDTFRQQCSTTQSNATARAAAGAKSERPCPRHEAAVIDLADVHVVLNTDCVASTSAVLSEGTTPGVDTPSDTRPLMEPCVASEVIPPAETLEPTVSRQPGTGDPPEPTHELPRSFSRAGTSDPDRLSSNFESSHCLAHQTREHSPARFTHADDPSMQEIALGQSGSSGSAVAVVIRATGLGAFVSLEVQELSTQDSPAENALGVTHDSTAEKLAEVTHATAARARAPDSGAPSALQAAADSEDRAAPSSPREDSQGAVSSSPGKRGLLGRLEGGLRSWLGRGSKQQVGQCLSLSVILYKLKSASQQIYA